MKNDDELEDFFRDVFKDAELEPSAGLWDKISQQQDTPKMETVLQAIFENAELSPSDKVWDNIAKQISPKPKKPRLLWWTSGIAASVAITLGAIWFNSLPQTDNNEQVDNTHHKNSVKITENSAGIDRKPPVIIQNSSEQGTTNNNPTPKIVLADKKIKNVETHILPSVGSEKHQKQDVTTSQTAEITRLSLQYVDVLMPFELDVPVDLSLKDVKTQKIENLVVQNSSQTTKKWWVGVSTSYQFYNPNFVLSENALQTPSIFLSNPSIENSLIGQALQQNIRFTEATEIGIEFGRKLGSHFGIQTGFYRNVVAYEVNTVILQKIVSNAQSNGEKTHKDVLKVRNVLIGIPIGVRYESQKEGFNYAVLGGLQTDFFVSQEHESQLEFVKYAFPANQISLSAWGGVELAYKISPNWQIGTEISYRQHLQSIYQGQDLVSKPTRTALRLGIRYNF